MEVERDRLATVTDVPGICEFRDDVEGHRIVGARTDEAVIGRRCRSVDPTEGGLVHVKQGNHLVAGADELAPVPGFIAVRRARAAGPSRTRSASDFVVCCAIAANGRATIAMRLTHHRSLKTLRDTMCAPLHHSC